MKRHIDNPDVCSNGCGTLNNIAKNGKYLQTKVIYSVKPFSIAVNNRKKAGELGAIEVVLSVMNKHVNNANVCLNGLGALDYITEDSKNQ